MSQANHAQNMPPVDSVAFCGLREDHKVHGIQSAFFKPQIAIPRPIGRGVVWDNHFHIAVLLATQNRRSGRRGLGREPRIWSSKGCGLSQVECKRRWTLAQHLGSFPLQRQLLSATLATRSHRLMRQSYSENLSLPGRWEQRRKALFWGRQWSRSLGPINQWWYFDRRVDFILLLC